MIDIQKENGIYIVKFIEGNRFIRTHSEPIKEKLVTIIRKEGSKLVIDLTNISFVDSSGFNVFTYLHKESMRHKSNLFFCNISPSVRELLTLLKLDTIFSTFPDLDSCLKSIQAN